jgi:WD repeat-containing protein 23
LRIDAHEDDVNAVAFVDTATHILASGGDDGLCKIWDRRALREDHPTPVGVFAGHTDGITFIDPRGDGRYIITNSKDQSIKLWDLRRFSNNQTIDETRTAVRNQNWDYRWQQGPSSSNILAS